MGLDKGTNRTFIAIRNGQIALPSHESNSEAVRLVSQETGKVSYVEYFKSITGYLDKIVNKQDKFDEKSYNWILTITDDGSTYELSIKEKSGYARSLMNSLPNVDFSRKITFSPYMKTDGSKKKATLYLSQDDKNVEWFFTLDNRNGLPELIIHTDARGNTTYDDSAINDFYLKYVEEVISPRIAKAANYRNSNLGLIEQASAQEHTVNTETFSDGMPIGDDMPEEKGIIDDLPF